MSAADGSSAAWRKSSACLPSDCVEVTSIGGHVLIRDSADKAGGHVLMFRSGQWSAFIRHVAHEQHGTRELLLKPACLCPGWMSGQMLDAGTDRGFASKRATARGGLRRRAPSCTWTTTGHAIDGSSLLSLPTASRLACSERLRRLP